MTGDDTRVSDEALLEKQAVAWFTRMHGRPSPVDRADFHEWLAASPTHERHYRAVEALWGDLGSLADALDDAKGPSLEADLDAIRALRRARQRRRAGAGIVLGLALVVAACWTWLERPHLLQDWRADEITGRGELRMVALPDGSNVQLDADSAIALAFSAGERQVRLLRGTAFFTVRPSTIPFVVTALDGQARVLGTTFEVSLPEEDEARVTLAGGSVEVGLRDGSQKLVLKPGESVAYGASGLGQAGAVDLAEATAWREGRLIFTDTPLSEVVQRVARYRQGRIVVLSGALGQRRVSGNVTLRDTDAALAALQSSVGFRMTSLGRLVLIGP